MARVTRTWELDEAELASLRQPRTDLLVEAADGNDRWRMIEGPFDRYERTLAVSPTDRAGRHSVTERTRFKLAVPFWSPYLLVVMRPGLANRNRTPRRRAWWPEEVVTAETSRMIGLLGAVGAMTGFMGVLIGQTITFVARDFGADVAAQANTLAGVRIGVLLSLLFVAKADRWGRRPLILGFALAAIVFTAVAAAAPNLLAFGAAQAVARGLTTGLITLVTLAATEEVPASSRAIGIAFLTLATGFGAALVLWVLPLADVVDGGWRLIYLFALLFLPILWRVARLMPETRRFTAAAAVEAPGSINWNRFALVAGTAFASSIFLSPASQLRNDFLTDDIGFTATGVSAFQLLISIPAMASVPIGGYLADRYPRRIVGGIALAVSASATAASYQVSGWQLWAFATVGICSTAAAVPALRGYQTELFPTKARGRVGGLLDTVAVAGSALGLVMVGALAVRWDDLGAAIGVFVFVPLAVAVVIFFAFPDTTGVELEDLNPSDPRLGQTT